MHQQKQRSHFRPQFLQVLGCSIGWDNGGREHDHGAVDLVVAVDCRQMEKRNFEAGRFHHSVGEVRQKSRVPGAGADQSSNPTPTLRGGDAHHLDGLVPADLAGAVEELCVAMVGASELDEGMQRDHAAAAGVNPRAPGCR